MARNIRPCSVEGCNNLSGVAGSGRGFCGKHYKRWKKHGAPEISLYERNRIETFCGVGGCSRPIVAKGMCGVHRRKLTTHGDPLFVHERHQKRKRWIQEIIQGNVDDCIEWPFGRNETGRGIAFLNGRSTSAPRVVCEMAHGKPPTPQHQSAHSCGNGHNGCVNPKHLRWATSSENEADKIEHGTVMRGDKINTVKLTESDVRTIRASFDRGAGVKLATLYGVSPTAISRVRSGKSWGWLD